MKKKLSSFNRTFQDTMGAAAFAEAGEFATARQLVRSNREKKVLLGTGATSLPLEIFRHAMNLCRRAGATLEILHAGAAPLAIGPDRDSGMLKEMGIDYRSIEAAGDLEKELLDSTSRRNDIIFVLLHALAPRGRTVQKRELRRLAARLHRPVVVLKDEDAAKLN
jgi:hypothetical protein